MEVQKLIRGKTPKSNNRYIDFNAVESIKAAAIEETKTKIKSNWVSCLLMPPKIECIAFDYPPFHPLCFMENKLDIKMILFW